MIAATSRGHNRSPRGDQVRDLVTLPIHNDGQQPLDAGFEVGHQAGFSIH